MSNFSELIAVSPERKRIGHTWSEQHLHDIDDVLVVGRKVFIDGQVRYDMYIASVDRERNLVAIVTDGHSTHINRGTGSLHFSSKVSIYRYIPQTRGNEVRVILPYTPLFRFPFKLGAVR